MKKKLMGGGTYTRAEFMRMMEKDGAVLVVKKEWAAKTATPPLLGEDKLAEEYVLKSQGELELDVLKLQIEKLKHQSEHNRLEAERALRCRALRKNKFEEINDFLMEAALDR